MSNLSGLTVKKKDKFISELARMPNISRAARLIGMSRQRLYQVRDEDLEFRSRWDEAIERGIERLEEKVWNRAETTSDVLAIFLLKANRPGKYLERIAQMNFNIDVSRLSDDQLQRLANGDDPAVVLAAKSES